MMDSDARTTKHVFLTEITKIRISNGALDSSPLGLLLLPSLLHFLGLEAV